MKNRALKRYVADKSKTKFGRLIALTGARQTGKTTLLKNEFSEFDYISFDDPVLRPQFTKLSAEQWYQNYPKAILDEIQKAPAVIESIKAVYDKYSDAQYILSGSSQILLLEKVRESLAGRISLFELFPLTLPEVMTDSWGEEIKNSRFIRWINSADKSPGIFDGIPLADSSYCSGHSAFEKYLEFGAMPALSDISLTDSEKEEWLHNYIVTYLQRDISDLGNIKDLEPFVLLQKTAAGLTGQVINYSDIARTAGISPKTAMKFMTYLSLSYQTIILQPWFRNHSKRLSKAPKLHFIDPGIQRSLTGRRGELTGHEFESAVAAEIIKQLCSEKVSADLYHLRTSDGREIDLLIELDKGFVPIEIKKTTKVSSKDIRHLKSIEEILDKPVLHSFVLSQDPEVKKMTKEITGMPVTWFLG
ncbi:MAG: ATP-binding protein [Planctomycetota bacterium]